MYCENNPVMFVDPWGLDLSVMEAALISENIYNYDKNSSKKNRTVAGWRQIDTWVGRESLKMGIYIRNEDDWRNPTKYVIAFKGTSILNGTEWKNNAEQLLSSKSADMWDAINYARGFVEGKSQKITFVGHSKGAAEAVAAAVATNRDAIIFNPASANLLDYGLSSSQYSANMTAYIVKGDILNLLEGGVSKAIDNVEFLPQQYGGHWYEGFMTGVIHAILNHGMSAVKDALKEDGYK